ncbi:rhomboid family intramembrane serine protease [Brotaphodocola sp.]|uniref:rhomboid family intramembrane serine protease n=1 Tax=Brotaphodocola sp. TaxID=3073577 RepID=UPI003D7D9FC2
MKNARRWSISFNSPVVLGFAGICLVAWVMGWISGGRSTSLFFSVYRSSLSSPLTYVRMIGYVFGHASLDHLVGNMTLLLIIGPMLEEKYGSINLLIVMLITAAVTGIASFLLFPHVQLLGASGVVSAFILLSSFTSIREHYIPLTFLLVAVLYLGGQVYDGIFVQSNISNFTHILGGVVGAWFGFFLTNPSRRFR